MLVVRFHPESRRERIEAKTYFDGVASGLGGRFDRAVSHALDFIERYPLAGSPLRTRARAWRVLGFPYSIVYAVDRNGILIIAIAHHSRKPGYWRGRTRQSPTN